MYDKIEMRAAFALFAVAITMASFSFAVDTFSAVLKLRSDAVFDGPAHPGSRGIPVIIGERDAGDLERRVCSNGVLEFGEACDDGNKDNGDGCDSLCRVESGFVCAHNSPSSCIIETSGKDCTVLSSTGLTPLTDFAQNERYFGYPGGLYPSNSNSIPEQHLADGVAIAQSIEPLDSAGNVNSSNGKIGVISIGFSNPHHEWNTFTQRMHGDNTINSDLVFVNGAQPGEAIDSWISPNSIVWQRINTQLRNSGINFNQVQVAWVKLADYQPQQVPGNSFPTHAQDLSLNMETAMKLLKQNFPNLKIAYLSSRTRAYTSSSLASNPWPMEYEEGFATKWLIERQIKGDSALNFKGSNASVPWMAWGPYLWADGINPRNDGFTWTCSDVLADGLHPSDPEGRSKIATLLENFFKSDPTSSAWFTGSGGSGPVCGNNICELNEDVSCPQDCTAGAICGNNIKETGEACDGTDLGTSQCTDFGFSSGTLSCNSDCTFNTSQCTSPAGAPNVTLNTGGGLPDGTILEESWDINNQPTFNCSAASAIGIKSIDWVLYDSSGKAYMRQNRTDYLNTPTSLSISVTIPINDGQYSWNCSAVDANGVTSAAPSNYDITFTEPVLNGRYAGQVTPHDLTYMGIFDAPKTGNGSLSTYSFGKNAIGFYPLGDPNGPNDGYPGSLFLAGNRQQDYFGEISIVPPSLNHNSIPSAQALQPIVDGTGGMLARFISNGGSSGSTDLGGFAYDETSGMLVGSLIDWYNAGGANDAPMYWTTPDNIVNPSSAGMWNVGSLQGNSYFHSNQTGEYMAEVPLDWANTYVNGQNLASGYTRHAGAFGGADGPALYTWSVTQAGSPPLPNTDLPATVLLSYPTNQRYFPHWKHSDEVGGMAFVETSDGRRALVMTSLRHIGLDWYGQKTDQDRLNDCCGQCNKGWHSGNNYTSLLFYDLDDLAEVAQGTKLPHQVLPYIEYPTREISPTSFGACGGGGAGDMTYDPATNNIYTVWTGNVGVFKVE